ncbi:MAG: ABC transporter transmembrane domain-containing protein [[Ruminococcus] torques]
MESKKGKSAVCWIYQYSKKSLWLVILLALISGAIAGSFILLALVSSSLLDVATGVKEGRLGVQIFLIVCLILLQAVLNILSSNVRIHATTKIEMQIRQGIFAAVLKKQYQHVSKIHSGEILNRLTSDIDIVVGAVVGLIPQAISMITKIVAGLAVLFSIDARFTAAVLGIGLLVCIFSRIYSRHFKYLHKEVQRTNGVVRSYMQECIENLIVIKSFANEHAVCGKLNQFQKDNYRIRIKRNAISNLANTLVYVLFTAGYYAALVWGAFQISFGVMTFGTLTAFLQIIQQIRAPFRNVSGLIPQYYSMQASAERLMEIEDMEEESQKIRIEDVSEFQKDFRAIVAEHVTFAYQNGDIILDDVSLRVNKGDLIAIVGESGIGKSTMMKLMLHLMPCESGKLYFVTVIGKIEIDAGTRNVFLRSAGEYDHVGNDSGEHYLL